MIRGEVEAGYRQIQEAFAIALLSADPGATLTRQEWERPGGGGGQTWTLVGPGDIERGTVNFSAVWGDVPESMSERLARSGPFYATGVSTIVHPRNPHAPTFHANLRYLETDGGAWFGGGADLTPYYLYPEDARHFHGVLRQVCGRHAVADHRAWKAECDRYFYLPHRREARGAGGIFFDHQSSDLAAMWAFELDLASVLAEAYLPLLARRVVMPYAADQEHWHELRRGRYVEFNLVWDRGTRFGLETAGRTASVLASLPPRARWDESFIPEPGSPEAALVEFLSGPPRDW